ncbi:hypothetical protein BpHYR1_050475 [Brachionus plicatilis]|uniref:Uncharacterized protein n=1 Tax=Brachionus plicatilis TaxID=10195 RepID=A0A3M7RQ31_BRAPC|nr:hypothetical protein BpHYR1_050475 [Brachionus plicatilis]
MNGNFKIKSNQHTIKRCADIFNQLIYQKKIQHNQELNSSILKLIVFPRKISEAGKIPYFML